MPRIILDDDLERWEIYATTGLYGFPDGARVVFRCVSDPAVRARAVTLDGHKSDAEELVSSRTDAVLKEMLAEADQLD